MSAQTARELEAAAIKDGSWADFTSLGSRPNLANAQPSLTYKDTNGIILGINAFDVEMAVNHFTPEADKSALKAVTNDSDDMREMFIGVLAQAYASLMKPIRTVGESIPLSLGFETKQELADHIKSNADEAVMVALRDSSLAHTIPVEQHPALRKTMAAFLIDEAKTVERSGNLQSVPSAPTR